MLDEKQRKARAKLAIETYIANCRCRSPEELKAAVATMQEMANDCAASFGEGRAILVGVNPRDFPTAH